MRKTSSNHHFTRILSVVNLSLTTPLGLLPRIIELPRTMRPTSPENDKIERDSLLFRMRNEQPIDKVNAGIFQPTNFSTRT